MCAVLNWNETLVKQLAGVRPKPYTQGTRTQSHISPSIPVYGDEVVVCSQDAAVNMTLEHLRLSGNPLGDRAIAFLAVRPPPRS